MGNQQCCDVRNDDYKQTYIGEAPEEHPIQDIKIVKTEPEVEEPELSHPVHNRLEHYKEREQERLTKGARRRRFGQEVYVGDVNERGQPDGFGKIYKADGSVYLGEWKDGKAQGVGVYVSKDGSYYEGQFRENRAEGQGHYYTGDFNYEGHFLASKFHGIGTEKDQVHSFHGEYHQHRKVKGTLTWVDDLQEYEYIGAFDEEGLFTGKGTLREPNGDYEGNFERGEKHGKGVYRFSNGLRYQGDYLRGKKQGYGTIYNCTESVAYEGDFDDDIPHGIGYIYDKDGNKLKRRWINGIDAEGVE